MGCKTVKRYEANADVTPNSISSLNVTELHKNCKLLLWVSTVYVKTSEHSTKSLSETICLKSESFANPLSNQLR